MLFFFSEIKNKMLKKELEIIVNWKSVSFIHFLKTQDISSILTNDKEWDYIFFYYL